MLKKKIGTVDGFGSQLEKLLNSNNLSHRKFADLFGVSRDRIDDWATDKTCPTLPWLIELANFFKLPSLDCLIPLGLIKNADSDIQELIQNYSQLSEDQKKLVKEIINQFMK